MAVRDLEGEGEGGGAAVVVALCHGLVARPVAFALNKGKERG